MAPTLLHELFLTLFSLIFQQADLKCQLGDAGYIVFGVILFIWELLPTSLVVYFFRVRNPTKDLVSGICYCNVQVGLEGTSSEGVFDSLHFYLSFQCALGKTNAIQTS